MTCTATLDTYVVTDEVVAHSHTGSAMWHYELDDIPDGATVRRDGNALLRVKPTTLTCDGDTDLADHTQGNHHCDGVWWHDDTPGATPHDDPVVTDEMMDAAFDAVATGPWEHGSEEWMRAAITAAVTAKEHDR